MRGAAPRYRAPHPCPERQPKAANAFENAYASWAMEQSWIRVEFTRGTDRVSVFCAWHDGPPHGEIGDY
ncbi:hypothetical protein [Streptomyces sp. KHY 26]|uniref:hypothetical protein n=1 Tax=Streptomyces sp. KHY 26 TaxID=3097359 RepID=UPI00376EC355